MSDLRADIWFEQIYEYYIEIGLAEAAAEARAREDMENYDGR